MKLRIIKKPHYMCLHHLQRKFKWLPFWITIGAGSKHECEMHANNMLANGTSYEVVFEGESK